MDDILTVKEMAQLLKLNDRTVLKMAQTGALPAAKIGGQWRFKRELVDRWLDDRMLGSMETSPGRAAVSAGAVTPFSEMLDERLVKLDLEGSAKTELLRQLVQLLVDSHYLERSDSFLRKLLKREKLMTTALGDGVAFPHTRTPQKDLFERPKVVVGVSRRGVDFDALDGKPVHALFLICASDDSTHLHILAQLTRVIRGIETVERLLEANSKQEVVKLLTEWDRELSAAAGSTGQRLKKR